MIQELIGKWTWTKGEELLMVLLSAVVVYAAILFYTRVVGLRSFSKMSAADFAMTVAVGSLFASTISSATPSLSVGLTALAALFAGQWLLAFFRRKSHRISWMVDNQPLLLMAGSQIIDENLRRANVTRNDLFGKLREANALNYHQIRAVVFETTGDISVLHTSDVDAELELDFFENVIGSERLGESESFRS